MSNTLFVGERCFKLGGMQLGAGLVYGYAGNEQGDGSQARKTGFLYVAGTGRLPINSTGDDKARLGFASNHPGGANFCLGDGSVRFVSETIDHDTNDAENSLFEFLICYNDKQPVSW